MSLASDLVPFGLLGVLEVSTLLVELEQRGRHGGGHVLEVGIAGGGWELL